MVGFVHANPGGLARSSVRLWALPDYEAYGNIDRCGIAADGTMCEVLSYGFSNATVATKQRERGWTTNKIYSSLNHYFIMYG